MNIYKNIFNCLLYNVLALQGEFAPDWK